MNRKTRRMIQNIVVLAVLAIGIWWICVQFIKFNVSTFTDNAQVRRHIVPVNARVQGYIKKVCVEEYSFVHKGDTLVILEDREYRLKLAEAEAELQNAVSSKTVMSSAISTTESNIGVNEASILGNPQGPAAGSWQNGLLHAGKAGRITNRPCITVAFWPEISIIRKRLTILKIKSLAYSAAAVGKCAAAGRCLHYE